MEKLGTAVGDIVSELGPEKGSLLAILLAVQDASPESYVSEEAVNEIARLLNTSRSMVYSTASFYSEISLMPRGRHIVRLCINAPCEDAGKEEIRKALEKELGIKLGETTSDKMFSLEGVSCLGACNMSPAIKVDDKVYGDLTPAGAVRVMRELKEAAKNEHIS